GGDRERPERRARGEVARREPVERPRGHLLQAQDVRIVGGREPNHLVQKLPSLHRHGVAVEEVPAPDEHPSTLLPCASCSPIPRRSRPGTTTSSRPHSRGRARTSSWRRPASASATSPRPSVIGGTSASTRSP